MLSASAVQAAEQSTNASMQGNWEARTRVWQSPGWVLCLAEAVWWLGDTSCCPQGPCGRVAPCQTPARSQRSRDLEGF